MNQACRGKPRSGQWRPGKKQKQVKKVEGDKEEESGSDDSIIKHLSLKGTKTRLVLIRSRRLFSMICKQKKTPFVNTSTRGVL